MIQGIIFMLVNVSPLASHIWGIYLT